MTSTVTHHRLDLKPVRAVRGLVPVPGDKSISHRYVMLGSIAQGVTSVTHLSPGADVAATVACMRALGVRIDDTGPGALTIHGRGRGGLRASPTPHRCGELRHDDASAGRHPGGLSVFDRR